MTHYIVTFAYQNTEFVAASTPPAPTTFSNNVWSIGTFPATNPPSYTLTIEVGPPGYPALSSDVYATTKSDQCNPYTTFYEFG